METKKIKFTDKGDAWIYQNLPVLMAISEIAQSWIVSIFPAAAAFFNYMDNRPGLDALISSEKRQKIENKEIEKIKGFFVILAKNIETAKTIIISENGYIAINSAAEQAYNSVAPPCAPPDNCNTSPAPFTGINILKIHDKEQRQFYLNQLYNVFDIIYLPNYNSDIDDRINDDILSGDIRHKIVNDLINHAIKNPKSYPAIFGTWTPKTEKKTQIFINYKIRQFFKDITTRKTAKNSNRTEPIMLRARQAYMAIHAGVASFDAVIPTANGEDTTLYSYIADQTIVGLTPESYILLEEYVEQHAGDIDVDDDADDAAAGQQALFAAIDDEPDDDEPFVVHVKPPRPRTGRAARLKSQQAFDFGGDSDEE
jgi:hypothetical protein